MNICDASNQNALSKALNDIYDLDQGLIIIAWHNQNWNLFFLHGLIGYLLHENRSLVQTCLPHDMYRLQPYEPITEVDKADHKYVYNIGNIRSSEHLLAAAETAQTNLTVGVLHVTDAHDVYVRLADMMEHSQNHSAKRVQDLITVVFTAEEVS